MPITCIVTGCVSRHDRDRFGFYHVPTITKHRFLPEKNELSRKRRSLWLAAINRDDLTDSKIKYQRVCSRHFLTGKPAALMDETNIDWVPTQNMGHPAQNIRKSYEDVGIKETMNEGKIESSQQYEHQSHEDVDFTNVETEDGLKRSISTQTESIQTIEYMFNNDEPKDGQKKNISTQTESIQTIKYKYRYLCLHKHKNSKR